MEERVTPLAEVVADCGTGRRRAACASFADWARI